MKEKLLKVFDKHDLGRKTIGVDVSADEIVSAILQEYVDQRRPEVEDEMQKYEGTKYSDFGRLKELETIEEVAHN